jgi:DNA-directed RNA polymerase specialized sigma24 family protein
VLDPEAFRSFYDEALPLIYGYFLRRCGGSATVAEELTQETFVAAVGELRKRRQVDSPIPWISGIARHKLLDHYRRQERVPAAYEPDQAGPVGKTTAAVHSLLERGRASFKRASRIFAIRPDSSRRHAVVARPGPAGTLSSPS